MFKKKTNSFNKGLVQTVFNNLHEGRSNPVRKWYASVHYNGTSNLVTYDSKIRSEAVAFFEEKAHLNNGHVEVVGSFK